MIISTKIPWIVFCIGSVFAQTASLETGSDAITLSDDDTIIRKYPCPRECDCWLRYNPKRVDVACYLDILAEGKSFHAFNTTTVPSTMTIVCDQLDLRHSVMVTDMFSSLHAFYSLRIKGCQFTNVGHDVFTGMTSLKKVFINGAKGVAFHEKALINSGSTSLEFISIVNSGMVKAPNLCEFSNLWGVNFTGNQLKIVSDAGLMCQNALPNLIFIDLTDNDMWVLPDNISQIAPGLAKFSVRENSLTTLNNVSIGKLENLEYGLDLSRNRLTSLPPLIFNNTVKLKSLLLSRNHFSSIPSGVFRNLTQVTYLEMQSTNVNDSIWNQISHMTELQVLQLGSNRIKTIDTTVIKTFTSLRILDLSKNELRQLQNGTFDLQKDLLILNISFNQIVTIRETAFRGLVNTTQLDIRNNDVKAIQSDALLHLPSLVLLNASSNHLRTLPKFPASTQFLDLRSNALEAIDASSFYGMYSLLGINMRSNSIASIPAVTFVTNPNLTLLNIGYNRIQSVAYDAFPKTSKLSVLVLNNNNISDLGFMRYTEFTALKTLDLSDNAITMISATVVQSSLEEIFLSNNKIAFIGGFFFKTLTHLRYVDLRWNMLTTLSTIHLVVAQNNLATVNYMLVGNPFTCDCHLEWLKSLSMSQATSSNRDYLIRDLASLYCKKVNYFDTGLMLKVPKEHFVCRYDVQCLYACGCCQENQCSCRGNCHDNCTCFRSNDWNTINMVSCRQAELTSIPGNLSDLVTWMDLSGNDLRVMKKHELTDASRIEQLLLNHSNIVDIEDDTFEQMERLTYLDISNNALQFIRAGMFYGLLKLTVLLLNDNNILSIDGDAFIQLHELQAIDLSGNDLQILPIQALTTLTKLSSLYLAVNPWSCECEPLEDLKNFTSSNSPLIKDFTELTCTLNNESSPGEEPQSYHLRDLYLPDFCLKKTIIYNISHTREERFRDVLNGGLLAVMVTVLCIVTLILVVLGFAFWQRRFLKLWLYVKFGWKFERKEDNDEERMYDAFVSYSSLDEDFVVRELVPNLENQNGDKEPFKLCVHYRDFPVGASIAETIVSSVEISKRVIIVLSDNFLNSEWCHYEFQTAHHKLLEEKKSRIIMILLHDIDKTKLDTSLKDYLKTRTYVKYGDEWFWPKIEYALPKARVAKPRDHEMNNVPDIVRNNDVPNIARQISVNSLNGEGKVYIMENMRNFEADGPKGRNQKFDLEV